MRIILLGVMLVCGSIIALRAIETVDELQDSKMTRFCKSVPVGASYDDICAKYR